MFINIGFGNMMAADKILCMGSPDSAPVKRLVSHAREEGRLIDLSQGRKTRCVIFSDDGSVVLSALNPETVAARADGDPLRKDVSKDEG